METTLGIEARPRAADLERDVDRRSSDHRFFLIAAGIALTIVALGFGRGFFPGAPAHPRPRTALVLAHACVFASWIVLFAAQASLVAAGRPRVHRRLGIAGIALATVMVVLGVATALQAARTGYAPIPGVDRLAFLIVPLGDLIVFAPLVAAALYWRRTPDVHKRLMWLATLMLTFPAVTRLPVVQGKTPIILGVFLALLLFAPVYERIVSGRIHRVSLWGTVAVFLSLPLRRALGETAAWHTFARWLIQ